MTLLKEAPTALSVANDVITNLSHFYGSDHFITEADRASIRHQAENLFQNAKVTSLIPVLLERDARSRIGHRIRHHIKTSEGQPSPFTTPQKELPLTTLNGVHWNQRLRRFLPSRNGRK